MTQNQFIGRGESVVGFVLQRIFLSGTIYSQKPIKKLIKKIDFNQLDSEFQKHKFDFYVIGPNGSLVIEVNYKHGEKAAKKWNNVFVPLLQKNGHKIVTIDDYDCENIFKFDSDKQHKISWKDFIDVINALEKAGIEP